MMRKIQKGDFISHFERGDIIFSNSRGLRDDIFIFKEIYKENGEPFRYIIVIYDVASSRFRAWVYHDREWTKI